MERCWEAPVALASNYARDNLKVVALCASLGWISSVRPDGHAYTGHWRLTAAGVTALEAHHSPL